MKNGKGDESDPHVVNRTGQTPSYYRDRDNNKKRKLNQENKNNGKWQEQRRRRNNRNSGSEGQSGNFRRPLSLGDFLPPPPDTRNKFNTLSHDLRMSGTSDEDDDDDYGRPPKPRYTNGNGF